MNDTFEHKKSLGQNFLTSDVVPGWMCDAAELEAGETVFEIGPGTGALTKEMLKRGAQVIALEADMRAITALEATFADELASGQLVLVHGDARSIDLHALQLTDHNFKVIANIPYYLSGYLFRTMLESDVQPNTLIFLVQKEVAERIARDKKESLLSLSIKAYGTPTYIRTVGKGHFNPSPKIDSAIVAIKNINREQFAHIEQKRFFELLHLGFGQKRKQLLGNLSAEYDRDRLTHIFSTVGLEPTARAEDISCELWVKLAVHLVSAE